MCELIYVLMATPVATLLLQGKQVVIGTPVLDLESSFFLTAYVNNLLGFYETTFLLTHDFEFIFCVIILYIIKLYQTNAL